MQTEDFPPNLAARDLTCYVLLMVPQAEEEEEGGDLGSAQVSSWIARLQHVNFQNFTSLLVSLQKFLHHHLLQEENNRNHLPQNEEDSEHSPGRDHTAGSH